MSRYKSTKQYRSRLATQETKKLKKQTLIIVLITIGITLMLVFVGIPVAIKLAVLLSDIKGTDLDITNIDTIPPQTPILNAMPEATQSASLTISGVTEAGATATLFHNNQERSKTVVNASGQFEFLNVELKDGSNNFYVVAKDASGNESARSNIHTTNLDTEEPTLTITSPEDGEEIVGQTKKTVTVTGKAEPGDRVTLNGQLLVVRSDGSFSSQFELNEGTNELTFTAMDKAGNSVTEVVKVNYESE